MQRLMTRWTVLLGTLLMGALLMCAPMPILAQDGPPSEEAIAQPFQPRDTVMPPFVAGTVVVGLRGEVVAALSTSAPTWGEIEVLAVEPLDLRTGRVSAAGGEGAAEVAGYKLTVPGGTEWAAIEVLAARSDVVFAEPDWLAQIALSEPDKAIAETPFAITDTLYPEQWYMQRIGTSRAWALALEESGESLSTVQVVVIDTGVDATHPDLTSKLATGHNYLNSAAAPHDDNGHGTHVSGLVAAAANGTGMIGSGLQVEVVPFKALNANGTGGVTGIGQAIRDATDQGAEIINLSLELSIDTFTLRSAVQYAVAEGVLVIAASGNQGRTIVSYPAAYPSVLAVGATSYFDARTYYSNQGEDLDIVAPGGLSANSILSTWTRDVGAICPSGLRQVNSGVYCNAEGTSMATGIVSGVAALIMSLRPDLDADAVQQILLDSAASIVGTTDEVGQGRLDAAAAVRLALRPRLVYAEEGTKVSVVDGADVFTVTLPLTNPSLTPLTVQMTPTITTTWYTLVGPRTGEVSYGDPLEAQLVFTPAAVTTGTFQSSLRVTVTIEGNGTSVYLIPTRLDVHPNIVGDTHLFMPWTSAGGEIFAWAEPTFTTRTTRAIGNDGSLAIDLPFTMTVKGREYTDVRVFADGFVVASASASPSNLPNKCLANQIWPSFTVYGWWSSLSLALDSALSTFQPDPDRFVMEYNRFVSMGSSDPNDRVSFQIILHRNGQVELNYRETPEHAPASVTVGASISDGRFYNQVTCHVAGSMKVGEVPQDYQSFLFTTGDLY